MKSFPKAHQVKMPHSEKKHFVSEQKHFTLKEPSLLQWYFFISNLVAMTTVKILFSLWTGGGKEGERGKKGREGKGEPVGIHQYVDCRSFIIYAGQSFNYSNMRGNNKSKNMLTVAQAGTLLETRISSSLLMYETTKLVPIPKQCFFSYK